MIVDIFFVSVAAMTSAVKAANMENYTLYKQTFTLDSVQASSSGQVYDILCQTAVGVPVSHLPYILPQTIEANDGVNILVCK